MRETKDQTITRLKRVNSELTERLKDINKKNRSTRREGKDKMTEIEKMYKMSERNISTIEWTRKM